MLAQSCQAFGKAPSASRSVTEGEIFRAAKKSARATILVVDDEPLVRWAISETLEDRGYEVAEAGDASSAMRALEASAGSVDLVLLDVRLPDAEDLQVLSAMRRASPLTPIIVMTAYGNPELFAEAYRLGAFAVVDKPFELHVLPPLIERALSTRAR
jgi:DNA-binding NtrC family response regulator